jgi:predicted ATPase/class 3 adenylate cyclase
MADSSLRPEPPPSIDSGGGLPTGTVTFLFTDIEGSTRLLQHLGDRYADVLADQRRLIRAAFQDRDGHEIDTAGDGLFVAFGRATQAVEAAVAAQRAISLHRWPDGVSVRVRMGLHTGEATLTAGGYVGLDVHRASRISSAGHGGQILISQTTRDLVENDLPEGVSLQDVGEHRLKDLQRPERLFQVVISDLPYDFPPLKSLDALPNNLPVQLTSFVGREREIAEVKRLLTTTRLLTFTGAGGCGKTRLALQVAADVLEDYPNGVWLVELAPLSDPSLIPQAVAGELGIREQPGQSLLAILSDYLRSKKMIIILDNCEHLISECARLTDAFLHASPSLKILATSREGLGIAGELTYRVPSLSIPDLKNLPSAENLSQYEAVRLFIERAIFSQPTFAVTNRNAPAVAQVCHRLDGIPLAIELAAARVKSLPVEQIAKRLDDRFRLLTGGSRTALPRQQTLRAAIDWSYNLLTEAERVLLRRLSVFAGGWTLPAAEAVCGGEGIEAHDVLDLLTHLVDKSLVAMEGEGEGRYRLLETIRQYARDRLMESEEGADLRGRHLGWFLDLAEKAEPELYSEEQATWFDRLDAELDNIRAALEWSLGGEEAERGLRLAAALWWFWGVRAHGIEGREWLERALAMSSGVPVSARAKALYGAGLGALFQGDYERSVTLAQESLALCRELGDKVGITHSLFILAWYKGYYQGNFEEAVKLYEEVVVLRREIGDKRGIAHSLYALGRFVLGQGDHERAVALGEEGLAMCRELEDKWGIAVSLGILGHVARHQGDYSRATRLVKESLALSRELGFKLGIALCLEELAGSTGAQGQPERAAHLYGAAEALRQVIGSPILPSERADYDRSVAAVRAGLGEEAFAKAWAEGRRMSTEEAIQLAMMT